MFITLALESKKPLYEQLVEQIIAQIAKKQLKPGERLPSVRNLAADIGINMHTVNKAYQILRDRQFIQIHRQQGVVVHPEGPPPIDEAYIKKLTEILEPLIAESVSRNHSQKDFLKICQEIYEAYERGEKDG